MMTLMHCIIRGNSNSKNKNKKITNKSYYKIKEKLISKNKLI